jgi:16S rRNA processing protein RimM
VPDDRLVVGRVAKAHGIKGEVAVEVLTDHESRFDPGSVLLGPDGELEVKSVRAHQGRLLVTFAQIADRNAAERLRGTELTILESQAAPLPEGRWYPHQLEGFSVLNTDGVKLGSFAGVAVSPAHDLWIVDTGRGRVLVPAVEAIVRDVDESGKRIVIDPPEGLFP